VAYSESAQLMARWCAGDQQAATHLVARFTRRLVALVRSQLPKKLARRIDPQDVVQSAYRSFFASARMGCYQVEQSGELWHLLAAITLHKLQHQVAYHTADKRTPDREERLDQGSSVREPPAGLLARMSTPDEAMALVDEVEFIARRLKPLERQMLDMRLQGHRLREIAAATQRSERWVRRVLHRIKSQLRQRFDQYPDE